MGNSVLISIRPKWCELIAIGKKTVEVRKTAPKLQTPFKCYIYETLDKKYENIGVYDPNAPLYKNFVHYPGKVIGEFICANIRPVLAGYIHGACLTYDGITSYLGRNGHGCGLEIRNLVIYDKPKELSEFWSWQPSVEWKDGYPMPTHLIKRAPQSFMYVEELK